MISDFTNSKNIKKSVSATCFAWDDNDKCVVC